MSENTIITRGVSAKGVEGAIDSGAHTAEKCLALWQVCLDLVCNVQLYREQWPEVEVFARFMEEFYGQKELCFFL